MRGEAKWERGGKVVERRREKRGIKLKEMIREGGEYRREKEKGGKGK